MRSKLILSLISVLLVYELKAQETVKDYRNFPLTLSIQFQNFAMAFKKPSFNFQNFGIGIGTEVSHSSGHNWVQEFSIWWSGNKTMGNGLYFITQTAYRPYLGNPFFGEVKAGIGYKIAYRPSESFSPGPEGWQSRGRKGKGMLVIPMGVGVGVHPYRENFYTSPFLNYQFILVKGLNPDIPWSPETLMQFGTRNHFKSWKD
ncbi:hypothetical protein [Algoriphagus sediminis]|uniref:DUF3575 domain-containing protein n=1 Tax=Algoriphagus sediminis TaxID=3057113 RepID=A0ABT7Y8X0_9BACT|nr:hypothetical protein [Algoriphagus sediminis]MDN3202968.1 hypothetical protein [Algoriphagus sediminis]